MDSAWNQVTGTVAAEFSDLTDLSDATRIVVRLLVAGVLGGTLGWEREHAGKAAGVRTHMLVAMGAALFVLVSQQIGIESPDMSRVVQGIIAGIGFLGAGTMLSALLALAVLGALPLLQRVLTRRTGAPPDRSR